MKTLKKKIISSKRIMGIGTVHLVKSGTQIYMELNNANLKTVWTMPSAKRMFRRATMAISGKKVTAA